MIKKPLLQREQSPLSHYILLGVDAAGCSYMAERQAQVQSDIAKYCITSREREGFYAESRERDEKILLCVWADAQ